MSLITRLKEKFRIGSEGVSIREVEPIHRPSFSIGDSLGDIKVGVIHLKTQLERIESSMLNKEYFDQAMSSQDKSNLVIDKLDEALRILTELQSNKPSIESSKPSSEPRTPSSGPSLTEEAENHLKKAIESLRLRQIMGVFANRERTTPKQLAQIFGIKNNTATEHLRKLEILGQVRRISRGLYEKT
jgi:hypothetical protein